MICLYWLNGPDKRAMNVTATDQVHGGRISAPEAPIPLSRGNPKGVLGGANASAAGVL
jgi:hypothetical protein